MVHKPLRVLTCVWGPKHVDLFIRGTLKSLAWPSNKEALDGSTWEIITSADDAPRIQTAVEHLFPNVQLAVKAIPPTIQMSTGAVDTSTVDHSLLILMYLQQTIKACLDTKSLFLLAPPDTIFSEHSVRNLIDMGSQEGTCVSVAHPRVLPGILDALTDTPMSSEQMVKEVFTNHLHQSWSHAELGHATQNSLVGGVLWSKLQGNTPDEFLIRCQHRLPTVYVANFTPEDYAFFINQPSFGAYDHTWPGERHIRQERQRMVGSSDAAFICEVTDADKNIPPWNPQMGEVVKNIPDAFFRDQLHNCTNRLFYSVFRGK